MGLFNGDISLGVVTLQVHDILHMTQFYSEVIGMKVLETDEDSVLLGTVEHSLLRLITNKDVIHATGRRSGLYHFALLLPEENDLLAMITMIQKHGFNIQGAADHLFSQAIYLDDPEGNGIEIYVDRPRSEWTYESEGRLLAASDPLDIDALIHRFDGRVLQQLPDFTVMGHIHLSVSDLNLSKTFYERNLGLEIMMEMPSAVFLAKENYHHHIGMNIWQSHQASKRADNETGLVSFEVITKDLNDTSVELLKVIEVNNKVLIDPDGIKIILKESL